MKKFRIRLIALTLGGLLLNACADLEVENLNEPSVVISTPSDYQGLTSGALRSVNNLFTAYRGNTALNWAADYTTMTNNVNNWWDQFKAEPRAQFNNSLANANRAANVDNQWALMSSAINSSLTVIKAIEDDGLVITDAATTQMTLAASYFAKGMAEGYMGITFDQGWVADKTTDLAKLTLSPYTDVVAQSIADLEKSIAISDANVFTLAAGMIPTPSNYTNVQLSRLANTYAAHFMMSGSRTKADNDANNWAKILAFANKGIQADYIHNDDGVNNYHLEAYISGLDWYWRTDHRVIRMFDPSYPKRFPDNVAVTSVPPATTADARLGLYYKYETSLSRFNLSRGPRLRSHYRNKRWDAYYVAGAVGQFPYFFKYINDLIIAEAKLMTNDKAGAVAILNAGNRVTVGNLPALTGSETNAEILQIIWNERTIEHSYTEWAFAFMDARRQGILQKGCLLHFPVPATELLVMRLPLYSHGGQTNADGQNTSDGVGAWYTPPEIGG